MFRAYAVDLNEIYPLIQNEPAESIYSPNNTEEFTNTLKDILNAKRKFLDAKELCNLFFPSKENPIKALNWPYMNCNRKKDNIRLQIFFLFFEESTSLLKSIIFWEKT